jgi:hypothetical protein
MKFVAIRTLNRKKDSMMRGAEKGAVVELTNNRGVP